MDTINFLKSIYWIGIALCGLIGLAATSFFVQFVAGAACFAIYMCRTMVEAACTPER